MTIENNIETRTLKNKATTYRAVVAYRDGAGKQQNLYSTTYLNKRDAEKALRGLRKKRDEIQKAYKTEITGNGKLVDAYLLYYERYLKQNHEILTSDEWRQTSVWLEKYFKSTRLKTLTEAQVKKVALDYAQSHSIASGGALAKHLMHLNSFLRQAVHLGAIPANPLPPKYMGLWFGNGTKRKKDENGRQRKTRLFSTAQIEAIREYLLGIDYTKDASRQTSKIALLIIAFTGMRPEEVQALTTDSIERTADGRIKFLINNSWNNKYGFLNGRTKNMTIRKTTALSLEASQAVDDYLNAQKAVLKRWKQNLLKPFILLNVQNPRKTQENVPVTQASINKQLKLIAEKLGIASDSIDLVAYSLRHTFATELSTKVQGKYELAATLMGHTTQQYLKTYLHSQADEVDDLADNLFA